MMARYPAPMSGWSYIVPTVGRYDRSALAPAMPDRVPAGHHGLLGGAIVVLRACIRGPSAGSSCRASKAAAGAGGRARTACPATVSVCQGDVRNGSIEGIELKCPVVVESRALRQDSVRGRQVSRRARPRRAGAQPGRGQVEFRAYAAQQMSALGRLGRRAGRARRLPAPAAARKELPVQDGRAHPGAARLAGGGPHRRRRRLGRSAATRSCARSRGCYRRACLGRGRTQPLWCRPAGQTCHSTKTQPASARGAKIGPQAAPKKKRHRE